MNRPWLFDQQAIRKSRKNVGIELPTRCEAVRALDDANSIGEADYAEGGHILRIVGSSPWREANRVLWHELTHALQLERDFNGDLEWFVSTYWGMMLYLGCCTADHEWTSKQGDPNYDDWLNLYESHPFEAEAKKNEGYKARRYPLVVPR